MPITPIDLFQPPAGLSSILSGATQVLGATLNGLMQQGRDQANNLFQQERDFQSEKRAADMAIERRGRYAVTDVENNRNFDQSVAVSNRNFGLQQQQENRLSAGQLFNQGAENTRLGISEDVNNRAQTEADRITAERDKQAAYNASVAGQPGVTPGTDQPITPGNLFGPSVGAGVADVAAQGILGTPPPAQTSNEELAAAQASEEARANAAEKAFNPKVAQEARANAARYKQQLDDQTLATKDAARAASVRGGAGGITAYQQTQLDRQKAADEAKTVEQAKKDAEDLQAKNQTEASGLLTDTDAFALQSENVPVDKTTGKPDPKQAAKAAKFDDNQFLAEKAVAEQAKDRVAYVDKGGADLTKEQKDKRAKFYDLVVPQHSKILDDAATKDFLQKAGNDPAKARALAKAAGYSF